MDNINILLVEDNLSFALEVEMLIKELGYNFLGQVDQAVDAIRKIDEHHPDLILLDIGIKGAEDGLDLAVELNHRKIPIIFITQSRDNSTYNKAKSFKPLAYLVKPFDLLTLRSTLEQTFRMLTIESDEDAEVESEVETDSFYIRHNNTLNRVVYGDILWIKSDGNYCNIHTENKKFVTKVSLSTMGRRLERFDFIRVHKQFLVPAKRIKNINLFDSTLHINQQLIPIGRSYKSKLVKQLDLL